MKDFDLNIFSEVPEVLEVDDEVLAFAQEIWLCFNIEQHEMISDTKSGSLNIEQLLFNRSINASSLKKRIDDEIENNTYGSSILKYEVDVNFMTGSVRDIVVIDTVIFDNQNRTFKQRFLFK